MTGASWVCRTIKSSIGAKLVMALSGILLFLFLIAHLIGNLQLFSGPEKINHYAQVLRDLGPLLWVARVGLIGLAALHVATALRIVRANDAARPVAYAVKANRQVRPQTRSMWTTGLVLLGYALFHLAHFTWGVICPEFAHAEAKLADGRVVHDVYSMMVHGFEVWWISATYLFAMGCLALHLCHAIPSFFQTLGLSHAKYDGAIKLLGPAIATLMFVGYASMPVACWLGLVAPPGSTP